MTGTARYDEVADFYAEGWTDERDDPASAAMLRLAGPVAGLRVLDLCCGHGRISRALARGGARVVGVDVSAALVGKAEAAERDAPLGVRYVRADVSRPGLLAPDAFDAVVCCFGLSDVDDLDGAVANAAARLRPGGTFTAALLHPCFPGGRGVSGSWPVTGDYHTEGWWRPDGELSSLRRQVGASHRTLATYLNTLRRHGLWCDEVAEPPPPPEWAAGRPDAAGFPVFLVLRCVRADPAG